MTTLKGLIQIRSLNSLSAAITRPHRHTYTRTYPTLLVYSNGATIQIRHDDPVQIIKMPINIWTLSEAERKERLELRKPKKKVVIEDEVDDVSFDSNQYLKYMKRKK